MKNVMKRNTKSHKNLKLPLDLPCGATGARTYRRDFEAENLIYVNDNCECGSCPLLLAQNKTGNWRRLREIISSNKTRKNMGTFRYEIPATAKQIKIEEYKGEVSFFYNLGILVETREGQFLENNLDDISHDVLKADYDNPILIDLASLHERYKDISKLSLVGEGYYDTKSVNICPRVPILDFKYF